jgi:hypothetical protein
MAMTRRIYYGPPGHERSAYWTVRVTRAKNPVIINGSVMHALKAYAGVTIGCALSYVATDPKNKNSIPHKVYIASATKSTMLLVDKLKRNGEPMHAVWYAHSYPWIVEWNDAGTLKQLVKEDPSIMEREFTLRPPRRARIGGGEGGGQHDGGGGKGASVAIVHRGALARAVKAKLIGEHVAEQMTQVANNV